MKGLKKNIRQITPLKIYPIEILILVNVKLKRKSIKGDKRILQRDKGTNIQVIKSLSVYSPSNTVLKFIA